MTVPALWTKHRPLARAIASDFYLPGSERQDVEQEALIGLWEAARTHDDALSPFKVWASIVIRRRLTSCLRAATRHKQLSLTQSVRDYDTPYLHQVSDRVDDREQLRAVLHAIDNDLTEFQRHCVIGVATGLSYPEIDGNIKRVDNALMRARAKLREAA